MSRYTVTDVRRLMDHLAEQGIDIDATIWSPGDRYGTRYSILIDGREELHGLGAREAWDLLRAWNLGRQYALEHPRVTVVRLANLQRTNEPNGS